ncbi:MAG: T9SS type A sorting domain-containing protein, partial [Paludibacter sp.]|nr:T9SS type A sorting domain-containing protein [Paludibacter sp.]
LCIEEYPPFKICDSGEDGTEIFNLNILRNYLFQNYLNGNTNFDINFYERETYILLGTPALTHATVTAAGKKVFCSIISPDRQEFLSINLEFAETKHTSAELTLCQNELPYTWNDTIFKVGTVSGDYVFRRQAASGCDSIITLSLVVNKKVATNFTDMIGEGNTYSKHGFDLPEQRTIGTFTFRQNLQTSLGCDSIVTLTLTVKEGLQIEIYPVPEICGDDYEFVIKYLVEPNVEKVSAFFDEKATAAGFTDISAQSVSRQSITIALPTNIRPDYYTVRLFFEGDGLTKEFRVNFAVLYPSSIIRQKWNDVLALQNANYNGGYTFSAYEWYRNNVKIGGESGSYLYVGLNGALLDFTAQYRARITRIDDGVTLFTCPITPVPHTDYTPYPTFVNANQYFTINITNKLGKITIYNTFGVLIREQNIIDGANQILAPNSPGAYILKINDKNSMLIVR